MTAGSSLEARDAIAALFCGALFLPAAEEEVRIPVVILQVRWTALRRSQRRAPTPRRRRRRSPAARAQGDPANIYGVLERRFRPEALPQPDRFWRNVRAALGGAETWRPRVGGVQLKMVSSAASLVGQSKQKTS
jgi:hypothetical protein